MSADRRSGASSLNRGLVAILALAGCCIATYLTLYQWHLTSSVWDPVLGAASSETVLTSPLTAWLPVPDATLGAIAYLVEAIVASVLCTDRWRTAPRLIFAYSLILIALTLTGLALTLTQLLLIKTLCSLCLASAAISCMCAWLGRDELTLTIMATIDHGEPRDAALESIPSNR